VTALVAGAVAPIPAPAGSAAFGLRIFTGLLGVLLAVLVSGRVILKEHFAADEHFTSHLRAKKKLNSPSSNL